MHGFYSNNQCLVIGMFFRMYKYYMVPYKCGTECLDFIKTLNEMIFGEISINFF